MTRLRFFALLALVLVLVGAVLRPADEPPTRAAAAPVAAEGSLNNKMVLAISIDGLTKKALRKMGRKQLPNIHRLLRRGVGTRNARTEPEQTTTLPNHVGMVTGRRITPGNGGGHGVTWNVDRPDVTVHDAAGEQVASVFSEVADAGGRTAVFATKSKFSLLQRSWPGAIHRDAIRVGDDAGATKRMRRHLRKQKPTFTFLHLGAPDGAGHAHGWMSGPYKRALRRTDALIGKILKTRAKKRKLKRKLAIILTSDHGGVPGTKGHFDARDKSNYKVPFTIFAKYVDKGTNPYALSPGYERPGGRWYPAKGPQPIRNGDVANVSLAILGLGPVPDSQWGYDQQLNWR